MRIEAWSCDYCKEIFLVGEKRQKVRCIGVQGQPFLFFHNECQMRMVVGSVGHLLERCSCFGGNEEDPPELTRRESARLAASTYYRLRKEASVKTF